MSPADNAEQKRQHFRLEFPVKERPRLKLERYELEVLDVSEGGCSVQCDGNAYAKLSRPGTAISGVLTFASGEKVDVAGKVLRVIDGQRIALAFSQGVPLPVMMAEHRRILKQYGS
ncbi:MAG: hypothetical protein RIQ81_919 [Pseudomonadota bacterium]